MIETVDELKNKQLESYEQQERTNDIIARLKLSLEGSKVKAQQDEIEKQKIKDFLVDCLVDKNVYFFGMSYKKISRIKFYYI